jgi:putative transposase
MLKSYKYRIYPTEVQKELLSKHFGACRFIYNLALETRSRVYNDYKVRISSYELIKEITLLKLQCPWLKEIGIHSLQNSILNLEVGFNKFFKGTVKYPTFKNKYSKQSFRCNDGVAFIGDKIKIPKFKEGIKIVKERSFDGIVKSATISKTVTNKYFVSVLVDTHKAIPPKQPILEKTAIGIDLGIKSFIVTSEGDTIDNPMYLRKSLGRLKVLQRRVSRKKKGSSNRKRADFKVCLLHEKIKNQRVDFLQKLSSKLIRENQTICIEDLTVANMLKNKKLSLSISDAGWSAFSNMLKYKAEWYGKNILQIGAFEPSTKECSVCGEKNHTLTLKDREWVCASCGTLHNRDLNAAKNIKAFALRDSRRGTPDEPAELSAIVGAVKQEIFN